MDKGIAGRQEGRMGKICPRLQYVRSIKERKKETQISFSHIHSQPAVSKNTKINQSSAGNRQDVNVALGYIGINCYERAARRDDRQIDRYLLYW